jgi:hypothetical protein
VDAVEALSGSSVVLRTRTLSTGFWLTSRARNRTPPLCHTWHHRPERRLRHYLFSPGRSFISRDATENPMARTAAGSRSGMDEYELHGHLSEKLSRAIGNYFANFSSSVSRISQEIKSQ